MTDFSALFDAYFSASHVLGTLIVHARWPLVTIYACNKTGYAHGYVARESSGVLVAQDIVGPGFDATNRAPGLGTMIANVAIAFAQAHADIASCALRGELYHREADTAAQRDMRRRFAMSFGILLQNDRFVVPIKSLSQVRARATSPGLSLEISWSEFQRLTGRPTQLRCSGQPWNIA